ncbi:helix-turn-helix domain-containing protein [Galbibacter sp. BG1]|uniref:helix-turn-helix domain-containing protein n=1 Tax=Galbibacter sp. BG1 TaxID=1170699 RepID=UPI0015BAB535|nr:helix-turn-helix domain-containing protein [Galbibacter sp. BG1]QLE01995.1 helix-turn-helix domain-containing protein [Galbibacter sp. BG1]
MYTNNNNNRLEKIYLQLLELSKGNFSTLIERTEHKDDLEALAALVNMATEEIKDSFLHEGYVNFHDSYVLNTQILMVLNEDFCIEETNESGYLLLGFGYKNLIGKPFEHFISDESKEKWDLVKKAITSSSTTEESLQLSFLTKQGLELPAFCRVIHFIEDTILKGKTIVTSFDMVQTQKYIEEKTQRKIQSRLYFPKKQKRKQSVLQLNDIEIIRAVSEHIKNHLDQDLPSLKEMAHQFGTNEYKLKKGFKELNGMTVFQFLKEERLKKAHVIVEHSNKSFKEIAKMVGFKNSTHFSREFNIRFGYRPRALRSLKA